MRKRPLIIFNARVPIIKVRVFSAALIDHSCFDHPGLLLRQFEHAHHPGWQAARIRRVPASCARWASEPDPRSGACRALHRRGQL